ncbi:MAG TPA: hypothetical protein DCR46_05905 [Cytophagales bacterium]|nr:hypothetical protein [Cytophagales bacterium]
MQFDQMKHIGQIFILLLAIFLCACKKRPNFPKTPEITFLSVNKQTITSYGVGIISKRDSVTISLYFKDGDGDLGSDDSNAGLNLFCKVLRKIENGYSQIPVYDTNKNFLYYIDKNGRFPSLNPDGRQGPIEGTLNYGPTLDFRSVIKDTNRYTLKFQIYMKDNNGNTSNTVETNDVLIENYSDIAVATP